MMRPDTHSPAKRAKLPTIDPEAADQVVVLGGGPAGLTAAYQLGKRGINSLVLEKSGMLGGHARTESYNGYRFDIGGHRFFTKIEQVNEIWREVLGDEFRKTQRLSRIYYNDKFFDYPLKLFNVLKGLGLVNSALMLFSYLYARIHPYPQEENLEEWVSNRFGRRLFKTFFKTYTEKVWGIPCTEIRAEWAAQRITNLTFLVALKNRACSADMTKGSLHRNRPVSRGGSCPGSQSSGPDTSDSPPARTWPISDIPSCAPTS